jgi:hypothetical protein
LTPLTPPNKCAIIPPWGITDDRHTADLLLVPSRTRFPGPTLRRRYVPFALSRSGRGRVQPEECTRPGARPSGNPNRIARSAKTGRGAGGRTNHRPLCPTPLLADGGSPAPSIAARHGPPSARALRNPGKPSLNLGPDQDLKP